MSPSSVRLFPVNTNVSRLGISVARSSVMRLESKTTEINQGNCCQFLELSAKHSRDSVVVQQQALDALQVRKSTELPQVVVAKVDGVELVQRSAHILYLWNLVTCENNNKKSIRQFFDFSTFQLTPEVKFTVPAWIDVLHARIDQFRCEFDHFSAVFSVIFLISNSKLQRLANVSE
jgi:hypothetical protein